MRLISPILLACGICMAINGNATNNNILTNSINHHQVKFCILENSICWGGKYNRRGSKWLKSCGLFDCCYPLPTLLNAVQSPIKFFAVDTIRDPNHIIDKYEIFINNRLAGVRRYRYQPELSGIPVEMANKVVEDLIMILSCIDSLEKSDVVYEAIFDSTLKSEGRTSVDSLTGFVQLKYPLDILKDFETRVYNKIQVIGHEIRHGYQYYMRQLSIVPRQDRVATLHDITDEMDAIYFASLSVSMRFDKTITGIDEDFVRKLEDEEGKNVYNYLPRGPINLLSDDGTQLRLKTQAAGKNHLPILEYYYKWESDYK